MQGHPSLAPNGEANLEIAKKLRPVSAVGVGLSLVILLTARYEWGLARGFGGWQHLVAELIGISVAFSVFHVGWHADTTGQTLRGLAFSVTFLAFGILSLGHLLSMPDMPAFITANSFNKAVLFSYTSYLLITISLLGASLLPIRRVEHQTRRRYLGASLTIAFLLTYLILAYEQNLPRLFIGEDPVWATRRAFRVAITCLSLLVFARWMTIYGGMHKPSYRWMIVAMGIWAFGRVVFLFLGRDLGALSLCGHIHKVICALYIYWNVSVAALKRPYRSLDRARDRLCRNRRFCALGRLVGRLAHELKNPLAAIRASAQLSGILDDRAEREKVTQRIETEVDRLSELITLTLEVGWDRPEVWELVHIEEMILEVCMLWSPELTRLGITGKRIVDDGLPPIQGNRKLLQRALTNLVINAIEAMPEGGELCISAYPEASGSSIRLEVLDTGLGIPDEIKDRLFQGFATSKPHGTGLGLMITYQIIAEIHQGRIWFDTTLGKGTKFSLSLPTTQTSGSIIGLT